MEKENFKLELILNHNQNEHKLHYFTDGSLLDNAFTDFVNKYTGSFCVRMGQEVLKMDFFPDFSMIFEEVPSLLLNAILTGHENNVLAESPYLWISEQDIELRLHLSVQFKYVNLLVLVAPRSKYDLYAFNNLKKVIDRKVFFQEWLKLLCFVLSEMLIIAPYLAQDQGYIAYKNQLDEIDKMA